MATNWEHLRRIAKEIPEYRDDIEIGLLIGNNCVQAIKPCDVIPGKPQDPYAIRTALGWGLIGVTTRSQSKLENSRMHCHRIITKDVTSQNIGSTFMETTQVKEVFDPNSSEGSF
jgi:hypothetical protein